MQFHVGPATYTILRKYDLWHDDAPAQGVIDCDRQVIYVDGLIEKPELFEAVLRHEHAHAWEWHVGKPDGPEKRAQWAATVGQTFDRDYQAAGGERAFLRIPVLGTRPVQRELRRIPALSASTATQRCCGMCGQAVAAGSVASSEPVSLGAESYAVDRWMKCPVCDSVTCWRESCDESGTPSGGVMRARVLSAQDAAAWLAKHPAPPCEWNVA